MKEDHARILRRHWAGLEQTSITKPEYEEILKGIDNELAGFRDRARFHLANQRGSKAAAAAGRITDAELDALIVTAVVERRAL